MSIPHHETVPPHGRLMAAGLMAACALGLVANHFVGAGVSVARLFILILGPAGLLLGLGGIVEPKIVWSVGKYGQHLPVKYKIIGVALAAAGVLVTLLLVFVVYPLGRG